MVLDALIIFEMFAVCFGFDGHICPVVDGETQFWNENETWTVIYMPHVMKYLSPQIQPGGLAGHCIYDKQGAYGPVKITIFIGGAPIHDNDGYSVFTHEIRHAINSCADWDGHE